MLLLKEEQQKLFSMKIVVSVFSHSLTVQVNCTVLIHWHQFQQYSIFKVFDGEENTKLMKEPIKQLRHIAILFLKRCIPDH